MEFAILLLIGSLAVSAYFYRDSKLKSEKIKELDERSKYLERKSKAYLLTISELKKENASLVNKINAYKDRLNKVSEMFK